MGCAPSRDSGRNDQPQTFRCGGCFSCAAGESQQGCCGCGGCFSSQQGQNISIYGDESSAVPVPHGESQGVFQRLSTAEFSNAISSRVNGFCWWPCPSPLTLAPSEMRRSRPCILQCIAVLISFASSFSYSSTHPQGSPSFCDLEHSSRICRKRPPIALPNRERVSAAGSENVSKR